MNWCPLSDYKNIFGIPMQGLHSYRLLNTAIVDYGLSILLAIIIAYYSNVPLVLTTIGVLILGIIMHTLFGINTGATEYLGLSCTS